jgi:hypothetical protein
LKPGKEEAMSQQVTTFVPARNSRQKAQMVGVVTFHPALAPKAKTIKSLRAEGRVVQDHGTYANFSAPIPKESNS